MGQKNHRRGNVYEQKRRREEVAFLMDEMSKEELAEYAGVSVTTIRKDLRYIQDHIEEFFY